MLNVSSEFKTAIKKQTVASRATVTIGALEFDKKKLSKLEVNATAYQNGKVLGNIAQHTATVKLLGDQTKLISMSEATSFEASIGVRLASGLYEDVGYQTFNLIESKYDELSETTSLIGVDNTIKLNKEYVDDLVYPVTLLQYVEHVLVFCGLFLHNTSFLNSDMVIEEAPIPDYTSCKDILKYALEVSLCFGTINRVSNGFEFVDAFVKTTRGYTHIELNGFTHDELKLFTHYELMNGVNVYEDNLTVKNYWNLKKYPHWFSEHGVNTIKIGISQVDGEYSALQSSDYFASDGLVEVSIMDNPFVSTESKRASVIATMFSKVLNYKYIPYMVEYRGYPHLELGDRVQIPHLDGSSIYSPVYEHTLRYEGGLYGKASAECLSKEESKLIKPTLPQKLRKIEVAVDKVKAQFTVYATATDEKIQAVELKITPEAITQTVEETSTLLATKTFVIQTSDSYKISAISEIRDEYGETISSVQRSFDFSSEGLEIKNANSTFSVRLSELELGFYDGSTKTAYISNNELNVTKARIESSLIIGVHKIEKYNNSVTVFRYIGED